MRRALPRFKNAYHLGHAAGRPRVEVSDWEAKIFRFLRRVAVYADTAEPVELRVAGGWVRDKLLKRNTGDIDIAVRHLSGFEFASKLHDFAAKKAIEFNADRPTDGDIPRIGCTEYVPSMSSVAVIAANPSMSRHLETAAVRLDGHDLDFVQLRTEDYAMSSDHRIPDTVAAGTPEQDSARRDFTVNALFYNLHTQCVEDHTGYGVHDLRNAVLRTPLDSRVTLLEDPLRALRAIRFACQLEFGVHSDLGDALSETEVHHNLRRKVSRERIGSEIMQIINSEAVVRGLEMIAKHKLTEPIFLQSFSARRGQGSSYGEGIERLKEVLKFLDSNERVLHTMREEQEGCVCRKTLILVALIWYEERARLVLHNALRKDKQLLRDVRSVIRLTCALEGAVRRWHSVRDNPSQAEESWVEIAEIVREAGERLWVCVCIICGMKMKQEGLLGELMASGICEDICFVKHAVGGKRLQAELGIEEGPDVGQALRELMRVQLSYYYRRAGELGAYQNAVGNVPNADQYIHMLRVAREAELAAS